jgi:hypothetical protein
MIQQRTFIGFLGRLTAAQAAQKAIDAAADLAGREACVLHIDRASTRLTVYADRDTPIPRNTCALGVRFDSDPDILTADLRDERKLCGLGVERDIDTREAGCRQDIRRTYGPEVKQATVTAIRSGMSIKDAAALHNVPAKRAWAWLQQQEAA